MDFKKLEQKALEAGIKEVELYTEKKKSSDISVFDDKVSEKTEALTSVYAIRGVYNNQLATVYTEKDTDDEVDAVINQLKTNATYLTSDEPYFIYPGDKDYVKVDSVPNDFLTVSTEDKIKLLLDISKSLKEKNNLYLHSEVEYEEIEGEVSIKNTSGLDVKKTYSYAVIVASLILKLEGEMKDAYNIKFVKNLSDFNMGDFVKELSDKVNQKLGAKSIKSGTYKVVLKNNVLNSLMNAFSANFSAANVKRKLSFLEGCLDKQVFGKNITIIDDPFYKDLPVIDTFDDEGVSTKMKEVVKDGVLKTYLHNLSTASFYHTKSTGNGIKPSVKDAVGVSPINFCLKPGNVSFSELVREVKDGVLITDVTGLHAGVNAVSGDFNLQCSGNLIKNGVVDKPVTLIVLSGNFKDLLNQVEDIANDVYTMRGMSMPSIYVKSMNISGI